MAFWLNPGEKSDRYPAKNDMAVSNFLHAKTVTIGIPGIAHAIDYSVTFTLPKGERHTLAQFGRALVITAGALCKRPVDCDSHHPDGEKPSLGPRLQMFHHRCIKSSISDVSTGVLAIKSTGPSGVTTMSFSRRTAKPSFGM